MSRKRRTVAEHSPHPVDIHVGSRLRLRRRLLGMNQTDVGKAHGLTYQQIQKYERGANRISASRLYQLGRILDVPVSYFFDDMPPLDESTMSRLRGGVQEPPAPDPFDIDETKKLVRAYFNIRDPKVRNAIRSMIVALAR